MLVVTGDVSFLRQLDWFDPAAVDASVTVVGAGGIGSFSALALAKLGVGDIKLVDFDVVENHNLPNQLFAVDQVGEPKVDAAARCLREYTGVDPVTFSQRLEDGVPESDIIVSALDSMKARTELWRMVKNRLTCKRLIDGRLAGEDIVLYSAIPFDPTDIEGYEATLHSDDEGVEAPCTRQSVIDVGFAVASLVTRAVRRHYAGEPAENVVVLKQDTLTMLSGSWVDA